ncbi:hypothetical protein ZEAMMB73_Zm00001d048792 [Zea mays]|nr:hypothetical protein ZEAMMB73_Zm00001d048792 [Zea mays]AQK48912.1 hypothetical protein ZEAMMB73_Zm00001d048792 [Zea mays]
MVTASSFTAIFFSSAFVACSAEPKCRSSCKGRHHYRHHLWLEQPPLVAGGGTLATIMCIVREEGVATL